ncbi:MAG: hypothetical protein R3E53_18080 [Myxococcota bacterium]
MLGPQAMQKGSLVGPERLRADFTHDAPLTQAELEAIEDRVNEWIESEPVGATREMDYKSAIEAGAVAIFDEIRRPRARRLLRRLQHGLCGGAHARATGDLGLLKIVSESASPPACGASKRSRVSAPCATSARRSDSPARRPSAAQGAACQRAGPRRPSARQAQGEREADRRAASPEAGRRRRGSLLDGAALASIDGARLIAGRTEDVDAAMRAMVDDFKNRLGSGVVCLAAAESEALLAIGVTKGILTVATQGGRPDPRGRGDRG